MIQIIVRARFDGAPLEFVVDDGRSSCVVEFAKLAEYLRVGHRAKQKTIDAAIAGALEYFALARYERNILENKVENII